MGIGHHLVRQQYSGPKCRNWVISVILGVCPDVGFTPESDRLLYSS